MFWSAADSPTVEMYYVRTTQCSAICASSCMHIIVCLCVFQSSTQEFYLISSSLSRLGLELQALLPAIQSQINSVLLQSLLLDTPDLLAPAHTFLKVLNEKAAKWVSSSIKTMYLEVILE